MDRKNLIEAIIEGGDFKWEERAYLIDNGLGALAIFFASDFECDTVGNVTQKSCVGDKARQSVAYALSLADDDVFNAIRYIPQCVNETNANDFSYLTIGLYVMLADAVSSKYDSTNSDHHKTLLQACREEGLKLDKTQKNYDKIILQKKFENVLKNLRLQEEFPDLIEAWSQSAQFNFVGITNGQFLEANADKIPEKAYSHEITGDDNRTYFLFGPYAVLGMLISQTQKLLGTNTAISYALGNRTDQSDIGRNRNNNTEKLYNVEIVIKNTVLLKRTIRLGDDMRAARMALSARLYFGYDKEEKIMPKKQKIRDANEQQNAHRGQIEEILGYFPDNFLQIAHKKNYTYVYSQKENIRDVYPEGDILGFTEAESELTRGSNGGNLSRYEFMAFSLGDRQQLKSGDLEFRAAAQTAIHETMHRVFNDLMTQDERDKLNELVNKLPINSSNERSQVITTTSFADILNWDSDFYFNYNHYKEVDKTTGQEVIKNLVVQTGREEVICNLYSLWHTEPDRDNSPLNTPEVRDLMQTIEKHVHAAMNRLLTPKEVASNSNLISLRIKAEGTGTDISTQR